jgi:hypothetical protein
MFRVEDLDWDDASTELEVTRGKPPVRNQIPEFLSLEEEARFWDAHETTEFEDEWEPAELEVVRPLTHRLSVRLEGSVFSQLVAMARQRGMPTSVLAAEMLRHAVARAQDEAERSPPGTTPP